MSANPTIQLGDYIVIQRQKYTKLQKFGSLDATTMLGKDQLELRGLLDQPYSATFKMHPKETKPGRGGGGRGRGGNQRLQSLKLCTETDLRDIREVLGISASGADNRNVIDNGESQALKSEDIEQLREECTESSKIIEKIVENSKTFHAKTEYSQEKYLKKKEKKYFEFVQIRRPTIRLIAEIYYRQDAEKIMGMRMDTLSQLLSYANVSALGNFLMYESGTNGLLPASFLNAMGANTTAHLIHLHPGNTPQKQAMLALNLPDEQLQRCISVNIYSVLREYYQGDASEKLDDTVKELGGDGDQIDEAVDDSNNAAQKTCEASTDLNDEVENSRDTAHPTGESQTDIVSITAEETEPSSKRQKLDINDELESSAVASPLITGKSDEIAASIPTSAGSATALKWQLENRRASSFMRAKFDSLVVAAKEHPINIVHTLLPFVKPSRPIVVYSQCKEVLMELYVELKTGSNVTNLHLTSNWLRMYQILPNRSHPEVNMSGNSGYLLSGYTIS